MNEAVLPEIPEKKAMSSNQKWLTGCGIGCLVLTIIGIGGCAVLGFFAKKGLNYIQQQVEQLTQDFAAQGYEQIGSSQSPVINITDPATGKKLFIATAVNIDADCDSDIAIIATDATITGHIAGNVNFKGQSITIAPEAVIDGNLDVAAAAVYVNGTINGQVQGVYQKLVEGFEKQ